MSESVFVPENRETPPLKLGDDLIKKFRSYMTDDSIRDDDYVKYYDGFVSSTMELLAAMGDYIENKLPANPASPETLPAKAILDQSSLCRAMAGSSRTVKELSPAQDAILHEVESKIQVWWEEYWRSLDESGKNFWRTASQHQPE